MTPSSLLKLNDKGLISLDRGSKDLLQLTKDTGINYFKPLNNTPNSQPASISEFNKDLASQLPSNIDIDRLKEDLDTIKIPKALLSNKNPSALRKVLNKPRVNPNTNEIKASQLPLDQLLELEQQKLINLSPGLISDLGVINDIIQQKRPPKVNYDKLLDFIKSAHQSFKDLLSRFNSRPLRGNRWIFNL